MHFGTHDQLVLLGLLAVMAALLIAAPAARIPFPVFLVLGGLALGFVPGMPTIQLPPDVVLVAVLPPLLYISAYNTSLRDLRQNIRPIGLLAIVLVVATTCAVAAVAYSAIDGFSWSSAFVLGAVVSPTDALAATKIAHRLGVPRRIVAIIEGESLVNDGTALVLYKVAIAAVVAGGVCMGWHTPELTSVQTRLQGDGVWQIITFVLNALLFALVGLQLSHILDTLTGTSSAKLIEYALLVTGTVIVTRIIWVPIGTYVPRLASRRIRERDPYPPIAYPIVVSWAGMRGAVSLAAALAVPLTTKAGTPFSQRDLIIFLTFCVILGTLVVQGLTLPALIRLLRLEDDGSAEREAAKGKIRAAEAALSRLEELVDEGGVREDTAERLRGLYGFRRDRFASRFDDGADGSVEERSQNYQRLRRELLEAERAAIVNLRREGIINDDVMRSLERDLDLEDARLDV